MWNFQEQSETNGVLLGEHPQSIMDITLKTLLSAQICMIE